MAISVDTVYKRVELICNKAQGSGYLDPDAFNNYCNIVAMAIVNTDFEVFARTQKISDTLRSFIVKKQMYIDQYGLMQYPSNYLYFASLRTYKRANFLALMESCGEGHPTPIQYAALPTITVNLTDNDKIGVLNQSEMYSPSVDYPYAVQYSDRIQFYPINLGYAILDYIKKPETDVKWNYVIGANGLPEYTSVGSVDFDYDINSINRIVLLICAHFGVEIREEELFKAAVSLQATGE
jgi:hypothetical protein